MNKEAVPKQALKQKRFHEHYCSDSHNGIERIKRIKRIKKERVILNV